MTSRIKGILHGFDMAEETDTTCPRCHGCGQIADTKRGAIAHAPQDIAALIAEVERLRAIEKVLCGVMDGWELCGCSYCGYTSTEHEENHERLMAALNPQEECDSPRCRTNTHKVNESCCLRCQKKEEQ